jgi:DNA-binding transcriptional regulator LsrR (DeoR family)
MKRRFDKAEAVRRLYWEEGLKAAKIMKTMNLSRSEFGSLLRT